MLQTYYYDPFRVFSPVTRSRQKAVNETIYQPQVDIVESKDQYQLFLDLPGIDPQSIEVTEEKKVLTIKAQRLARELAEGEVQARSERKVGVFKRQFTLPEDVDAESIVAESQHGVLKLTLGRKQPEETLRKIEIKQ